MCLLLKLLLIYLIMYINRFKTLRKESKKTLFLLAKNGNQTLKKLNADMP